MIENERPRFTHPRSQITIQQLVEALLDDSHTLSPRYLYRLSDLEGEELLRLEENWAQTPLWRRRALMEDLHLLAEADNLLSFEGVGRIAILDSDPQVRFGGVQTLIASECDALDLIAAYLDLAEMDADDNVRAISTAALAPFVLMGEMDNLPAATQVNLEQRLLRLARSDRDAVIRRKALESLGYSGLDEVSELIDRAFQARDPDWIASALFAMGRSADERWQEQVLQMLDHEDAGIRVEAARAAGELALVAARSRLIALIEDPVEEIRDAALWSLSQIGGQGVKELFVRRLKKARDEQELHFLEQALDNLAFNSGDDIFQIFYVPEAEDEDDAAGQVRFDERYLNEDEDEDEYVDVATLYFAGDAYDELDDDFLDERLIDEEAYDDEDDEGRGV